MKLKIFSLIAIFGIIIFACKKDGKSLQTISQPGTTKGSTGCGLSCSDYQVTLTKTYANGTTTFIWGITNPCPGNGTNGSIQNLSHWDFIVDSCLDANWQDVLSASYRYGGNPSNLDTGFTVISPLPDIQPDPSLKKGGCYGSDVFKFDQGTTGSTTTYYKLVLLGNWGTGALDVYYKSGVNTGCCSKHFDASQNLGIGCPADETCSYSQGYWFANNVMHPDGVHPWPTTITIGGYVYTNADGLAIWNSSNQGGIPDSKKAFTQLAALMLSNADLTDPALSGYVATIQGWLGSLPAKLSGANPVYLPNQTAADVAQYGDARAAADGISNWINAHECASSN